MTRNWKILLSVGALVSLSGATALYAHSDRRTAAA